MNPGRGLDPAVQGAVQGAVRGTVQGLAGGISEDSLLGGRVRLRQPARGYRVAVDPVLLAASVAATAGERVLDLGCGVGAAGLCLLARIPGLSLDGLEIQVDLVRLAAQNAELNGVTGSFAPAVGDVAKPPPRLAPGSFQHVMCNPPYLARDAARAGPNRAKDRSTREGAADLTAWVATGLAMVAPRGSLTFVHRADRLGDLLAALSGRAGEIVIFPLWPGANKAAKRVIVRARRESATPLRLAPGLVLHHPDGPYTAEADAVLRHAQALEL